MKRILLGAAAAAAVLSASAASAQGINPVKFGIAGGGNLPQSTLEDIASAGWHAQGMIGIAFPLTPFALRADIGYARFGMNDDFARGLEAGCEEAFGAVCDVEGNYGVLSGTVNAIVSMPGAVVVKPYLIAGGGIFRQKADMKLSARDSEGNEIELDDEGDVTETRPGIAGGIGIQFPFIGRGAFIEAKYVNVFNKKEEGVENSNLRYVPITVGIMF
jgi:opacity protein-like surface antigen